MIKILSYLFRHEYEEEKLYDVNIPFNRVKLGDNIKIPIWLPLSKGKVVRIYDNGLFISREDRDDCFIPSEMIKECDLIIKKPLKCDMKVKHINSNEEFIITGLEVNNYIVIANKDKRIVIDTLDKAYAIIGINDEGE